MRVPLHCPGPHDKQVKGYPHSPTSVGEHIRKRRLDLKLRQIDSAKAIGCDELTVVNWEKGHTQPSVNHMAGFVRFLGFNPIPDGESLAHKSTYLVIH
jgi:transcriptional regulator with XRE-family HTH domain